MKPDVIIIPNCGVNRDVPDLNAAYAAALWQVPVVDLNSYAREFSTAEIAGHGNIAIATRTFAVQEFHRIADEISERYPGKVVGTLAGPVDVLCCYRYEELGHVFSAHTIFDDSLPMPGFRHFDSFAKLQADWQSGERSYPLLTSIGCPFGCEFCMARRRRWRPRSAQHCAEELSWAKRDLGVVKFQILDDCFNLDNARVLEFGDRVKRLDLEWYCNNGLRADCFSREQAEAMREAGCRHITFGVETADEALLQKIGKGETLGQIAEAIEISQAAGISTAGFFLIGLPGSSYETDLQSLRWARSRGLHPHFSYYVPPECWRRGGQQFWGEAAAPLSDAYDADAQRSVYAVSHAGHRVGRKVLRNTFFNAAGRCWSMVLSLVLTAYILNRLGVERYSVWALVSVIVGYAGLCDLGIRDAFTRFVAAFHAQDSEGNLRRVINTGLAFYLGLGALVVLLTWVLRGGIVSVLSVPAVHRAVAQDVFVMAAMVFVVASVASTVGSIQQGLQRMDVANRVAVAMTVPHAAGTVLVLELGFGLRGLVANRLIVMVLTVLVNTVVATRLLPTLRFGLQWVDRAMLRDLAVFGFKRWAVRIEDIVTFQTDKLLFAHFLPFGLVGMYELGYLAVSRAAVLPSLVVSAVVPAAAELHETRDHAKLVDFYTRGTKYMMLCSAPLMLFLGLTAPRVIHVWLGGPFDEAATVLRYLAVAFMFMSATAMGSSLAVGIGKPDFQMKAAILQTVLNVPLSIILVLTVGFRGPLIATVVSVVASNALFFSLLNRELGVAFVRSILPRLVAPLLCAGVAGLVVWFVSALHPVVASGRLNQGLRLGSEGIVFGGLYLILLVVMRQIGAEEGWLVRLGLKALLRGETDHG